MSSNDDQDLFGTEMSGVRPLQDAKKARPLKPVLNDVSLAHKRNAAASEQGSDDNYLSSEYTHALGASDIIDFRRSGMQHGVMKKFRLAYYDIEATLDLHQMTVDQARSEVFSYIRECLHYGLRTVLINHGKGTRSVDKVAVLKSCVAQWLPQMPQVLAVHSAQTQHGGGGAVYILLKKSDKDKLANKEKHAKGKLR